jgi:HSP20 family protein
LDRVFAQLGSALSNINEARPAPRLDLVETKDGIECAVELPGVAKADVKIMVEGGMLTLTGEKRADKEGKGRSVRIREREFGTFERTVVLPAHIDPAKIKAVMADGVLTITAPKLAGAEARTIKIQSPGG